MTKEELEKEAEEKYNERLKQNGYKVEYRNETYIDGYLDSAEPREKQIQIDAEQIRALQKQNGELTDELKSLRESVKNYGAGCYENGLRNGKRAAEKVKVVEHFEAYGQCRDSRRIAELEAQIEKMKCCENCAKNGHICVAEEMQGKLCDKNKDKWELRR